MVRLDALVVSRFSFRVRRGQDKGRECRRGMGGEYVDYCSRGAKVWQRCLVLVLGFWRLRSDRPRRPGLKWPESTCLFGLDSKEEWYS